MGNHFKVEVRETYEELQQPYHILGKDKDWATPHDYFMDLEYTVPGTVKLTTTRHSY